MQVTDLEGKTFSWNLSKYIGKKSTDASKLHISTRNFLTELWPAILILEEVTICNLMKLDFYIPSLKIAIECQGEQHLVYTLFYHGIHKQNFYRSRNRDNNKAKFCELNNIKLIYFFDDEDNDTWKTKIIQ
jgi:hypothetical protein